MDIHEHNRVAWDRKVAGGSPWTRPVDGETVAAARAGRWQVILTPQLPVPAGWFPGHPDLTGCRLLCLAGGGGQQGPVLAAAGADVTVLDASAAQLARDRLVADRDGLDLATVQGDMADLGAFADASFDLIFHPVANCFVPELSPVWRECFRVLRPGGALLAGFMNPAYYLFDYQAIEDRGELEVRYRLPYSDLADLPRDILRTYLAEEEALEWSHTLEAQIDGQLAAGFVLTGLYEDRFGPEVNDPVSRYLAISLATRAIKPPLS